VRDLDIRQALRRRLLAEHGDDPDTIVVEELGVFQGACRIDLAIVNGALTGLEIKSERDTLDRLPTQSQAYGRVFDAVTLVASERHLRHVKTIVPRWWGIDVASPSEDSVVIETVRRARSNPKVDPYAVAQLLWRDEALELLTEFGLDGGLRSKPRPALWLALANGVPLADLRLRVRCALRSRPIWRDGRAARRPANRRHN
jgi:hypothetical protein